jgi:hypothetical protein
MDYQTFKNKWLGKRVDIDGVYGFQCADLVKQYMLECYGIPNGAYGNAIDYWYNTSPKVLTKFERVSTTAARRGDIVIFKGVNGNPYGHIGICDSDAGLIYVNTLEQNGSTGNGSGTGGDAIRVRGIPRWRVVGVLRPRAAKPALRMPAVGSSVKFTVNRTAFVAGTTKVKGTLPPDLRIVRGYDPVYPNRILVNSASVGNGVAVALYYQNGVRIDGWQ